MPHKINPQYIVDGEGGSESEYVVCRGVPVPRSVVENYAQNHGKLVTSEIECQKLDLALQRFIKEKGREPFHISDDMGNRYVWEEMQIDANLILSGAIQNKRREHGELNMISLPTKQKIWFRYPKLFVKG